MDYRARLIPFVALLSWIGVSLHAYDKAEFLNFAIFTLPPEFFADIPLEERPALFREFSSEPQTKAIDYENGSLFIRRQGEVEESSKMLWLRLLPRDLDPPVQNPYSPLVYIHLATPASTDKATGKTIYNYATRVVMWKRKKEEEAGWHDVTKATMPESVDLSLYLPPTRKFVGVDIRLDDYGDSPTRPKQLLVWEDWEFHLRDAYPYYDDISWEAPLDAKRLAVLLFQTREDYSDHRELAELIAHAAIKKDARFLPILDMEQLRDAAVINYALAAYDYALNRNKAAIEFMVEKVAEEGNGDTDSKWMLSYFDEWDKTLEIYHQYAGTDGAAAEANSMFVAQRRYFFPENFKKFWEKKMDEIEARN